MPNVTITIPAETYRKARVWAAENNTTVTRAVRDLLDAMPRLSADRIRSLRSEFPARATSANRVMQVRTNPLADR